MAQVAIITGGASGMGLAVAISLANKGWKVSIADLNAERGHQVIADIPGGSFFQTDVMSYESLSKTFHNVFRQYGKINFVFANAGVGERANFYTHWEAPDQTNMNISRLPPPSELDLLIDIDLKSVILTTYLAQYYFRQNTKGTPACLILNASIAGIYPVRFCPIYTAAKHGVVGFARAIWRDFYDNDGIRVNTLCPGNVRTNLFAKEEWDVFDMEWIELSQIVSLIEMMLLDEMMYGQVIEAAPRTHYVINQLPYNSENVRQTLEKPVVNHLGK